jgi:hypothetical protein
MLFRGTTATASLSAMEPAQVPEQQEQSSKATILALAQTVQPLLVMALTAYASLLNLIIQ